MQVELLLAAPEHRPVLDRLLQLYQYDFSEITGGEIGADGLYHYVDGDVIWREPGWHVFLVRVEGQWAGFAFVTRHRSYVAKDAETWLMDEFFVLRKYRRRGVGEEVARQLFDRFPGRWEVSELQQSAAAQAFWRTVIGRYTQGRFQEVALDDDRWRGPVQLFDAPIDSGRGTLDPGLGI